MQNLWLSILPPVITIAIAIWTKKIIPSLLIGLLAGCYFLNPTLTGGFETTVDEIVNTLTDSGSLQVLLFLYLFSGLIFLIRKSGGIKAFSDIADKHVKSERGVFFLLWALIPVTFIDCGFRIVGAGSITGSLAEKNKIAKERFAFMLNNTASPVVELIPIATTYVGFNIANISIGLKAAGNPEDTSAYAIWLKAIPLEFFSIVIIIITFLSIFYQFKKPLNAKAKPSAEKEMKGMKMNMEEEKPLIKPRVINLILPLVSIISLSVFLFWFFGKDKPGNNTFIEAMSNTDPNRAMLVALFITIAISAVFYFFQKYNLKEMTSDIISGGNEIMTTLVILTLAWPLASVSQALGLNDFIQLNLGTSMPAWSVAVSLFIVSSAVTYFIGSGWGAASLLMPGAISLAVVSGAGIPLCVAAIITGGTFGDVTSPVAGMTNMSSNIAHADHAKYLKYASSYNFIAAGIAAILFLIVGVIN
ncbi:MAG: Na+/H+ antiporter NhaC family protein [Bacteroidota bacterium]|nr:Na+/H+ antiporter NhaC family protein [Bacteroidota bacterium]